MIIQLYDQIPFGLAIAYMSIYVGALIKVSMRWNQLSLHFLGAVMTMYYAALGKQFGA